MLTFPTTMLADGGTFAWTAKVQRTVYIETIPKEALSFQHLMSFHAKPNPDSKVACDTGYARITWSQTQSGPLQTESLLWLESDPACFDITRSRFIFGSEQIASTLSKYRILQGQISDQAFAIVLGWDGEQWRPFFRNLTDPGSSATYVLLSTNRSQQKLSLTTSNIVGPRSYVFPPQPWKWSPPELQEVLDGGLPFDLGIRHQTGPEFLCFRSLKILKSR